MCLYTVTKINFSAKERNKVKTYFRLFSINIYPINKNSTSISGVFQGDTVTLKNEFIKEMQEGKAWIHSSRFGPADIITTNDGVNYTAGFHCYTRLKDAKEDYDTHNKDSYIQLWKIRGKKIVAKGSERIETDNNLKVVVLQEIQLVNQIKK